MRKVYKCLVLGTKFDSNDKKNYGKTNIMDNNKIFINW